MSARGRIATPVREAYDNRAHATTTPHARETPTTTTSPSEAASTETPTAQAPTGQTEAKPKRRSRKKTTDVTPAS